MNQDTNTVEGNKLISIFVSENEASLYSDNANFVSSTYSGERSSEECLYQFYEMKFNSSWDWLMPVVEKIESMGYDSGICSVVIKGERLSEVIFSPVQKKGIEIHSRQQISKLLLTWQSVIQFITHYNSLNKQP